MCVCIHTRIYIHIHLHIHTLNSETLEESLDLEKNVKMLINPISLQDYLNSLEVRKGNKHINNSYLQT